MPKPKQDDLGGMDIYALTKVTAERDEALAACAAMRESLEKVNDETGHQSAHIKAAMAPDAGKVWIARYREAVWLLTNCGHYERTTDNAKWWERREKFMKEAQSNTHPLKGVGL
jgi:hypothetical protein